MATKRKIKKRKVQKIALRRMDVLVLRALEEIALEGLSGTSTPFVSISRSHLLGTPRL